MRSDEVVLGSRFVMRAVQRDIASGQCKGKGRSGQASSLEAGVWHTRALLIGSCLRHPPLASVTLRMEVAVVDRAKWGISV